MSKTIVESHNHMPRIITMSLTILLVLMPSMVLAQNNDAIGGETWRFRELEFLIYSEKAEQSLSQAQSELSELQQQIENQFRASGLTRLSQYNCPARLSLPILEENIDLNITTARLYQKYGHYFLCLRAYDIAMTTLSKAIPLFQTGYGRETLMQRDDQQYVDEARKFYDTSLHNIMQLIEASGAWQSYAQAQALTNQYWPRRNENVSEVRELRGAVVNAWEDAIRLLNLLGMAREEDDARGRLRLILTFDISEN